MQRLSQLLKLLIDAEVEFVLVGGLAAAVHGSSLHTRDVDVCCRFTEANLMKLQTALAALHPVHRMNPNLPLEVTKAQGGSLKNLHLCTDLGILDCLGEVRGVGGYDEVFQHSICLEMPIGRLRIIDLATLITAKEAMGRPHDLIAVQHLRAVQALSAEGR